MARKSEAEHLWELRCLVEEWHALLHGRHPDEINDQDEYRRKVTLHRKLSGKRFAARTQKEKQGNSGAWIDILMDWDLKAETIGTLEQWRLDKVTEPPSGVITRLEDAKRELAEATGFKARYNQSLYQESQRLFGKFKDPVLEMLRIGYGQCDGEKVAAPTRVVALKEAAKYFHPQIKQVEINQTITQKSGVMLRPERSDPQEWATMVKTHLGIITDATQKLQQVASGVPPTEVEGEFVEVVEEKPPAGEPPAREPPAGEPPAGHPATNVIDFSTPGEPAASPPHHPPPPPDPPVIIETVTEPELTRPPKDYGEVDSRISKRKSRPKGTKIW